MQAPSAAASADAAAAQCRGASMIGAANCSMQRRRMTSMNLISIEEGGRPSWATADWTLRNRTCTKYGCGGRGSSGGSGTQAYLLLAAACMAWLALMHAGQRSGSNADPSISKNSAQLGLQWSRVGSALENAGRLLLASSAPVIQACTSETVRCCRCSTISSCTPCSVRLMTFADACSSAITCILQQCDHR